MVDRTEQFFRRVTNAELDGKITVPNGGYVSGLFKRTHVPSATENDDLSAYLYVGRQTENARSCRISDVSASTMWPSRGRVLPRGGPRPSDCREPRPTQSRRIGRGSASRLCR